MEWKRLTVQVRLELSAGLGGRTMENHFSLYINNGP